MKRALAALSGVLLALAFPKFSLSMVSLVALVPLLIALRPPHGPIGGRTRKNLQTPPNRRMKASCESAGTTGVLRSGLILPFAGEVGCSGIRRQPDERSQTGILTSGFALLWPSQIWVEPSGRPRKPSLRARELVSRYSGATVPDSHGVPSRLAAYKRRSFLRLAYQRAVGSVTPNPPESQEKTSVK